MQEAWKVSMDCRHELYHQDGLPNWNSTRGPMGALILSLERLKWVFDEPGVWTDDLGVKRILTEYGPKLFHKFLKESVKRNDEREVAATMGYPSLRGRRACFEMAKDFIGAPERTSKRQKEAVQAAACNAV